MTRASSSRWSQISSANSRIFSRMSNPYTKEDFWADLLRVTAGKTDRELATTLIDNSFDTIRWMHSSCGIPMEPAVSLAGIKVGNQIKFQKGAIIRARQEGVGLSKSWFAKTESNGIEVRYDTGVTELLRDSKGTVVGIQAMEPSGRVELTATSVVLGCGGFEANSQWRAQYLGAPWDHAKVRGTAFNQGDGLRMALARRRFALGVNGAAVTRRRSVMSGRISPTVSEPTRATGCLILSG